MKNNRLAVIESKFADIIWENEPLTTAQLVALCSEKFNWKRTTTYTVLKRLSDNGLFQNNGGTVTSLISREDYYAGQSRDFVEEAFDGSLPAFLTAFTSGKKLSKNEVAEIQALIDNYSEE